MASIQDLNTDPAENTSIGGINIGEGMTPGDVNNAMRVHLAWLKMLVDDSGGAVETTGSGNAYAVAGAGSFASLAAGVTLAFKANHSNSGAATLNVTPAGGFALGAKAIRKFTAGGEAALAANDVVDNQIYVVRYDPAANTGSGAWLLLNPSGTATLTGAETLTNKTLTNPTINDGTLSGTFAGAPTISGTLNVVTELYRNGAIVATRVGTETLTNKTLTTPTINGAALSGTLTGTPTASGAWTFTATPTVSVTAGSSVLELSTTTNDAVGAYMRLTHVTADQAAADQVFNIDGWGRDSASNAQRYGTLVLEVIDPTSGSEDGAWGFFTVSNGSGGIRAYIGAGIYFPGISGGDKGASTINFGGLYQNNVQVATLSGSETLTSKTLTSPTINAAALSGTLSGTPTFSGAVVFSAKPSLTGGALSFPSTQVPSAGANDLDDYEEGTWTPGITFGGAFVGGSYTTQAGTYVKVGRAVTIDGLIALANKGSSTGSVSLTGLPFSTVAGSTRRGFSVGFVAGFSGLVAGLGLSADASSTNMIVLVPSTTSAGGATDANCSNSSQFQFGGTYITG